MILKITKSEERKGMYYGVTEYIDNITFVSYSFDEEINEPVIKCKIGDSHLVSYVVKDPMYLMNDNGKTIECIYPKNNEYPENNK